MYWRIWQGKRIEQASQLFFITLELSIKNPTVKERDFVHKERQDSSNKFFVFRRLWDQIIGRQLVYMSRSKRTGADDSQGRASKDILADYRISGEIA